MSAIALLLLAKLILALLYRLAYPVVSLPGFFLNKTASYTSVGLQEPYASALAISCIILLVLLLVSVWVIMYLAKYVMKISIVLPYSTKEDKQTIPYSTLPILPVYQ